MGAKKTRDVLIAKYTAAILALNKCDEMLYQMIEIADGKSDPITEMAPVLADGHKVLHDLWENLRSQM